MSTIVEHMDDTRDWLFEGLPCINYLDDFIVYSPFTMKLARVNANQIHSASLKSYLEKQGFWETQKSHQNCSNDIKLALVLSTDCNLKCEYCYVYDYSPMNMTSNYLKRIIDEKLRSNPDKLYITFYGGEPSLNMKALKYAVEYIKQIEVQVYYLIVTNGTLTTESLDYCIDHDFTFIVSNDGIPAINNQQRVSSNMIKTSKQTESTIRHLAKREALFQVRATITKKSLKYFPDNIAYWKSLGVSFVHFEPESPSVNSSNRERLMNSDEYIESVIMALDEAEKNNIYIISSPFMNLLTPSDSFCTTINGSKEVFTPDGAISSCYQIQSKQHPLHQFLIGQYDTDNDSFDYACSSNVREENEKFCNSHCSNCFAKYICSGGCPLIRYQLSGNILNPDNWSCRIKKALIHEAIIRIYKSVEQERVPVVFGESIFESRIHRKPKQEVLLG